MVESFSIWHAKTSVIEQFACKTREQTIAIMKENKIHKQNKQQHLLSLNLFASEERKEVIFRIIQTDLEHEPSFHPNGDYLFLFNSFCANC